MTLTLIALLADISEAYIAYPKCFPFIKYTSIKLPNLQNKSFKTADDNGLGKQTMKHLEESF